MLSEHPKPFDFTQDRPVGGRSRRLLQQAQDASARLLCQSVRDHRSGHPASIEMPA
jgi:hypothetical protein